MNTGHLSHSRARRRVSLSLDPVRDQKDAFFADLHGLKANLLLFQDHRLHRAGGRKFVIDASEKVFRTKKRAASAR